MPDADTSQTAVADVPGLRDRIEELALQTVLEDIEPASESLVRLAATLESIGAEAGRRDCPATAGVASELAEALRACESASDLSGRLREGMGALLEALRAETEGASAPVVEAAAEYVNPLAQDPELLADFVVESREHLGAIEARSLVLEQDPGNQEAVNSIFRSFHTIKGLAGFLEMEPIRAVSHEVETILDAARNGTAVITPAVIDVVLESADFLGQSVRNVDRGLKGIRPPAPPDPAALLGKIQSILQRQGSVEPSGTATAASMEPATPSRPEIEEEFRTAGSGERKEGVSLRVDASKLDYLMDMVGEMVIAQSLLRNEPGLEAVRNPRLQRNLSQLARTTGEVQRTVMSMRMVPIGKLFQRMSRLVRDLARKTGKAVNFETSGEDTEVDKSVAEELADPLMHMLRNALDHGIEEPEERRAAGKNATASVRLDAYHQSGHIVVEVSDDGRGIERERVLAKAVQKGIVEANASLADNEILNLIFEPGFSTAQQVTDVSGRGVGMDVVRKHIQKLRGRIDIQSVVGQGTRFLLKLPLTLAMIDGLVVSVGDYRYVVPIFAVREMFRPAEDQVFTVENRDEMVMVRGKLLPVVRLHTRFAVKPRKQTLWEALVIVSEFEGKQFCLMVDELIGKQEVVIKSLGETFKHVTGVAGGAILGDGRVGLILDLPGVFGAKAA